MARNTKSVILVILACGAAWAAAQTGAQSRDWAQFGSNSERTSAFAGQTGITAANVASLHKRVVTLDGEVDASAIYLHRARVKGAAHDTLFVTTTYGKTIAIDANSGDILWEDTPSSYAQLAGSRQVTNTTPIADPGRQAIYTQTPDGMVRKLAVSDGHEIWATSITKLPLREKMDSSMNLYHGKLVAVTAGYNGDRPPYQGHVAILDAATGQLEHVFNTLCSNRTGLMDPASCPESDSAIWGRAGEVIDPATGDIFLATGNAAWDGKIYWGDAILELNPDATRLLGNYTPSNTDELNDEDLDLGSTSPALLPGGLIAQGGKDGIIRIVSRKDIAGSAPHKGGELSQVPTPESSTPGRRGQMLFSNLAVWNHGGQTWVFAADGDASEAFRLDGDKLVSAWNNDTGGTSPVVAGGLLYIYGMKGGLNVYEPASGKLITTLDCGPAHWSSPIVVDGHIILPEGNANRRVTTGVLNIWSVK